MRVDCKDLPSGCSKTSLISRISWKHSTKVADRTVTLKVQKMVAERDKPAIPYAPGNPFVFFFTLVASKFF